jgi:nitrogen regulatory protein PII
MGSLYKGVHIGWTTDAAKASALEKAGARVTTVTLLGGKGTTKGFEISVRPDATVQAREGMGS